MVTELNQIFKQSTRSVTYEDIHNLKYLEQVIQETWRLYPPIPLIARTARENIQLGKHPYKMCFYLILRLFSSQTNTLCQETVPWQYQLFLYIETPRYILTQIDSIPIISYRIELRNAIRTVSYRFPVEFECV